MLSKDDPIGEVELQLGEVNFYEPNIFHLYLSPCTGDRVRALTIGKNSTYLTCFNNLELRLGSVAFKSTSILQAELAMQLYTCKVGTTSNII